MVLNYYRLGHLIFNWHKRYLIILWWSLEYNADGRVVAYIERTLLELGNR
jgi:hypothetical protein